MRTAATASPRFSARNSPFGSASGTKIRNDSGVLVMAIDEPYPRREHARPQASHVGLDSHIKEPAVSEIVEAPRERRHDLRGGRAHCVMATQEPGEDPD